MCIQNNYVCIFFFISYFIKTCHPRPCMNMGINIGVGGGSSSSSSRRCECLEEVESRDEKKNREI